ncbi:MAG: DUF1684 domain-containing protein [Alphaproteobacteria bacterium]|nr:DUF1684 domain-containing protein [Alphaproteobacteria bacterium]
MKALRLAMVSLVLAAWGAGALPVNAAAVETWKEWRAKENAAWSTEKFAILKIDDAVYLNEGQSAWLTNRKQKMLEYVWTLDALAAPDGLRVAYRDGGAAVVHKGQTKTFTLEKPQTLNVSPGIDVRFALTEVKPGVNGLRVMVYNQGHPAARAFKGLEYFSYNPNAVVEATFEPSPSLEGVDFQTSRGWFKRFNRVGFAVFTLEGKPVRLAMYTDKTVAAQIKSLSAFFLDELSGKKTYGVGRYMDIDVDGIPAKLTIDFNRAYNPNCARSPHYNCPFATDKVPVKLRAGEKAPSKH